MKSSTENPAFSEAVRYWEPRRLLYDAVLVGVVIFHGVQGLPASLEALSLDAVLVLCVLAVLANVLYCAAYPVDIFLQYTAYANEWRRLRVVLFVIGTSVAMILTRFVVIDMFNLVD